MKAVLHIVLNYITQLKKDNAYDDTLVLVMGDHGDHGKLFQIPLLMVKDGDSASDFSVSSIPLSYDNIIPMLEERLDGGVSCNDFLCNASLSNDTRYIYYYNWDDNPRFSTSYLPFISEYAFIDGHNDMSHLKATGKTFRVPTVKMPRYKYGDTLVFDGSSDTVDEYLIDGFSIKEGFGRWSAGKTGIMRIPLASLPHDDILVRIKGGLFTPNGVIDYQTVRISANGQFIEEKRLTSGDWSFVAPRGIITERKLDLSFEYPDAASPFELGLSQDKRLLAVGYKTMTFSENKP
jgi:hypothetical protein